MKNLEYIEIKKKIAQRIKNGIEAKGWNRKEFAAQMGNVNPSSITQWLSGNHNFTIKTIFHIEEVLDIKIILVANVDNQDNK